MEGREGEEALAIEVYREPQLHLSKEGSNSQIGDGYRDGISETRRNRSCRSFS